MPNNKKDKENKNTANSETIKSRKRTMQESNVNIGNHKAEPNGPPKPLKRMKLSTTKKFEEDLAADGGGKSSTSISNRPPQ